MPYKDKAKRREYARNYYSSNEQKAKKKIYDHERYLITKDNYKESRSAHTVPHRFIYNGPWLCAKCGSETDLVIHHNNHDHNDNTQSNLICLCRSCHSKLHIQKRRRLKNGQVISE